MKKSFSLIAYVAIACLALLTSCSKDEDTIIINNDVNCCCGNDDTSHVPGTLSPCENFFHTDSLADLESFNALLDSVRSITWGYSVYSVKFFDTNCNQPLEAVVTYPAYGLISHSSIKDRFMVDAVDPALPSDTLYRFYFGSFTYTNMNPFTANVFVHLNNKVYLWRNAELGVIPATYAAGVLPNLTFGDKDIQRIEIFIHM